jgi:cytochrome b involved in lipid metabolism
LRPALDQDHPKRIAPDQDSHVKEEVQYHEASESREEQDRKAMPPPIFKKPAMALRSPSPQTTPKSTAATNIPPVPLFSLEQDDELAIPSFPAVNSAQRASGGRGPPRLSPLPSAKPPLRNPNSLIPPTRSPLPNRSPGASATSSLAPPATHNSIPTKPKKKVLLTPGHSPLDWARLTSSPDANLRGLPADIPYLRVPPSLLKQFTGRKGKDAWTVLGGKVYNMTPYLPYHPGGEPELMKAAGRDGTKLFGEVHPWVNWEGMLEGCLIGIAVDEEIKSSPSMDDMD